MDLDAIARLDQLVQDVLDDRLEADPALVRLAELEATPLERPWPILLAATGSQERRSRRSSAGAGGKRRPARSSGSSSARSPSPQGGARTEPMLAPIAAVAASFFAALLVRLGLDASPDVVTLAALVTFLPA